MARFLSTASRVAAALSGRNTTALATNSRGYLAAAGRSAVVEEKSAAARNNGSEEVSTDSAAPSSSWVPDPVTGYYRPANRGGEVDPADLRATHLSWSKLHR